MRRPKEKILSKLEHRYGVSLDLESKKDGFIFIISEINKSKENKKLWSTVYNIERKHKSIKTSYKDILRGILKYELSKH